MVLHLMLLPVHTLQKVVTEANVVSTGSASTFAAESLACVGAADTIDVTIAGAAAATGRLRVYAVIADVSAAHTEAAAAQRDLL